MSSLTPYTDSQLSSGNVEIFNFLTARILVSLYEAFPHQVLLNVDQFLHPVDEEAFSLMDGTMEFLQREGFITFTDSAGGGQLFLGVQLTMRGFAILNATPHSLQEGKATVAATMKSALAKNSGVMVTEAIKTIVSEYFKG